ncbi:MAG: acetylxylan esterase [Pirellulales bacterium]
MLRLPICRSRSLGTAAWAAVFLLLSLAALPARAEVARVLPEGKLPADARLGELKTLDGYFPLEVPASREAWEARAAELRNQLRVALGLWPMPAATPANAVIHGRLDRGDYTVEKVYFQSWPGHFVTGSLYRPKGKSGRLPGVLCPHGHWSNGRFYDAGAKQIKQDIVSGAERFEDGGRSPLQSRCVQLARMGCVVFHYDMVGYGDSMQIEHRPGVRKAMNTPENFGYFSPQAEMRLVHMMGLQSYNSIRALDFLCGLDDVDAERIAVTGASGGGTQTFILCALDPRPKVAFLAVMVSTAMQGGCTCENCCYLRVGTGNVEIAALFAPKPLGMTGAEDWTREIATKGLPELKKLYALYGHEELVMARPLLQFGHNYNYVSRAVMYPWINRHLGLGLSEPIVEESYERLSPAELTVWDAEHPRPAGGDDYERGLVREIVAESDRQLAAAHPHDSATLEQFRELFGAGWRGIVGGGLPAAGAVAWEKLLEEDRGDYLEYRGLLREAARGAELPTIFLHPKEAAVTDVVLWVDPRGKSAVFDSSGAPLPEIKKLLDAKLAVAAVDLLYQGEFLADDKPLTAQPMVGNPLLGYAGYTFGYNPPLAVHRARDLLATVSFIRNYEAKPERVHVVATGEAAGWVALARAIAPSSLDRAALAPAGFRFGSASEFSDPNFVPGSVKYGDVPALVALAAPSELWLADGASETPQLVRDAYAAAGATDKLHAATPGDAAAATAAAVDWLLGK